MEKISENKTTGAAGKVTTAALVLIFAYSFVLALSNTLINEIIEEFSLEGAAEGLVSSLLSIGFIVSLFFMPIIQGRAQKTTVLIAACILQAVMLASNGFAPTFLIFGISCVILGFSGGFVDTYCNSIVVDVRKEDSSKYLGYLHGLYGVGSLIAPLLFFSLLPYIKWRGVYFVIAAFTIVAVAAVYMMTRAKRQGHGLKPLKNPAVSTGAAPVRHGIREHKFSISDFSGYIKNKRSITLVLSGFFANVAQSGMLAWIVRYMTLRFEAAELGALAISLLWLCATFNRFFFSQIVKRAPLFYYTVGSFLFTIFLTIGVFSANAIIMCVVVGVLGLCGGHVFPVLISESAVGYEGKTSFTTSIVMFIAGLSRIVTPVFVAFTSDRISLTFGIMVPAVASLIAAIGGAYVIRISKIKNS